MARGVDGAALIACVTAILFGWGTTYHQGYISVFNLNPDVMEQSFHQVVYQGAVLSMAPLVFLLMLIVIFLVLYSDVMMPLLMATLEKRDNSNEKLRRLIQKWRGTREPSTKELKAQSTSSKAIFSFLALLIYYLSLHNIYDDGKETAQKHLDKLLEDREGGSELMVHLTLDDKEMDLGFIDCGARNCAGLDLTTNRVFYFPVESGYSFTLVGK